MGSCSSKQEGKLFERQITAKERGTSTNHQGTRTNGETLDDVEDYLKEIENHISPTPNGIFNESEMLGKSIHKNINKPRKAFQANSKDKRNSTDSGIVDAWKHSKGIPKPVFADNNNNSDQTSTADNEYNKEGVDLVSTVENGLSRRVSPDEFPEYDNMTKPILYREESDEAFDPSTLVDIEKFKAVNFPSSKVNADENNTDEPREEPVSQMTETEDEQSSLQHHAVLSPSVMYNEDERALMDSIEKDFVQVSLPGAVS